MLGYSDSNKDGGFGMANFSLNNCQIEISELMIKNNIDFRIFHGREAPLVEEVKVIKRYLAFLMNVKMEI